MAELSPRPALPGGVWHRRGLLVALCDDWQMVAVAVPAPKLAAVQARLGLYLPATGTFSTGRDFSAFWAGHRRWLVVAAQGPGLAARLEAILGGVASVSDQGDGRVALRLTGPALADSLAQLLPIDTHPRAFPPGAVALTIAAHIPVHIWREADAPEGPRFVVTSGRSHAMSLLDSILATQPPQVS